MHFIAPFVTILLGAFLVDAQLLHGPFHRGTLCSPNEAFLHDDGFFYQFFDCPMSWNDAEETCASNMVVRGRNVLGGHLVSILTKEESDWLQFQINARYGRQVGIWIGLKRARQTRGSCSIPARWTDGKRVSYVNFADSEPNCWGRDENCFHLVDNYRWGDAECEVAMRFVCKIEPIELIQGEQATAGTEAPREPPRQQATVRTEAPREPPRQPIQPTPEPSRPVETPVKPAIPGGDGRPEPPKPEGDMPPRPEGDMPPPPSE